MCNESHRKHERKESFGEEFAEHVEMPKSVGHNMKNRHKPIYGFKGPF
jgi:hypothetical protein